MEDGDDTPAGGQQAAVLSPDSHVPPPEFSFDFSTNRFDYGSTSEESVNGQIDLDLPHGRTGDDDLPPARLAEEVYHSQSTGLFVQSSGLFVESEAEHDPSPMRSVPPDLCDAAKSEDETEAHAHPTGTPKRGMKLEIVLRSVPLNIRAEYEEVHSNVVERVVALSKSSDEGEQATAELTDGTLRMIPLVELDSFENGPQALDHYFLRMERAGRKRKYAPNDDWETGSSSNASDVMEPDGEEEPDDLATTSHGGHTLRSREQSISKTAAASNSEESDDSEAVVFETRRRSLRTRQPRFPQSQFQEEDHGNSVRSQGDEDGDLFMPVVSDIASTNYRGSRAMQRSKRLLARKAGSRLSAKMSARKGSGDSDIEFEEPRRSSRATRNVRYMLDDMDIDDNSFVRVDEKPMGAPKVASIKELFRPLPSESPFASAHMGTCHTCGNSNNQSQIIYCQGCSYAYHKPCIGSRSAREHLVTKVGEADFVLQCRFCIEVHKKKDPLAPGRSMCQTCRKTGRSCTPFSQRQTARQEEKLREQNGGVDPVATVPSELVNNADNVLFRCASCNRGWHKDHLPTIGSPSPGQSQTLGAIKDYSVDWQCNECTEARQKIHRLIAWRTNPPATTTVKSFEQLTDDDKEYLVKWEGMSYFHCAWLPGAWIFGVAAGTMRSTFAKKALEVNLFKANEKEAVPDEYLMIDIVFRVKFDANASRGDSKKEDLDNLSRITKTLVKFQGLGYDDVVWDQPPSTDSGELYEAFEIAYQEYLAGKYFKHSSQNRMRERIKAFKEEELKEVEVQPAGLKRGKLMGYQLEGLNWLLSNFHSGRSVVLADEMGLGKTVQVVSLVTYLVQESPQCWPFLISVPNATCANWRREFKQWAPDVRVVTYHGGKESQDLAYKHELFPYGSRDMAAHVVIMSYDSTQDPKTSQRFQSVKWAGLIVDEGQRLKNDRSLLYQALRGMKIPFRLLLTGTPLQNNKRELFNLIQFIDHSQNAEKLDEEYQVLDKENLPKLHEKIRPYFLRRTKVGVLKFLPPMAQIILPVSMTVIQEKLSRSIMAKNPQLIKAIFANSKVNRKERGSLNNILVQLRKCLCHPFMYSEAIEEKHDDLHVVQRNLVEASAKLLLLELMLPKLKERGHRVLIFSQFLQQLDIIEDFLNGIGYQYRRLDGQLSSLEKQRRIDAYNEPDSPIFAFLLSTRAGGVGINLATADTVIIMDPDFNPHQDIQALSRAHRIGQKHKVLCFQLMTKDTVEERIMQIGKKKMALDHALIESMDDDDIAPDDLESILAHGAQALFSDDYQKGAIHYDGPSIDRLLDRSQNEQTKVDDEGSAEAQFSYAKVWSNDKSSLEDGLEAAAEAEAPEPISSSVWDKILAEREEEARRQTEASQEKLGRGGRRRTTHSYKPDALATYLQDGGGPQASDSSDDFAGAESSSSSDDHHEAEGKKRKFSPAKPKAVPVTPAKQVKTAKKVDNRAKQKTMPVIPQRNARSSPSQAAPRPKSNAKTTPAKTNSKGKGTPSGSIPKPSPTKRNKNPKSIRQVSSEIATPHTPAKGSKQNTETRTTSHQTSGPCPQTTEKTVDPYPTPQQSPAISDP